ncbi:MAG: hypothetical protein JNL83_20260 [Myxococcales bacterium]|nr:hypothetical protein [Myxococcales bacterium]
MRPLLAAALLAALAAGCAQRAQPYRFGSPMLGAADVPPAPLRADPRAPDDPSRRPALANRRADGIRVVSAPAIREASAAAAEAIPAPPPALRTPHTLAKDAPLPGARELPDLRALVGRRDARAPIPTTLALLASLGRRAPADLSEGDDPTASPPQPGDLLIFDHAVSDAEADLVAIVISRDDRGVLEMLYLGGGVYRRGFVSPDTPWTRRDKDGAVLNTFLRHGKRWPAKGSHYLAGELLARVIHTR